jgi:hypothetical protein
MNRRRPIIVRSNNPFYHPVVRGDGAVFVPTGPPRIISYARRPGSAQWNPAYWSQKLAPADRAVMAIGRESTRGAPGWPKGTEVPLRAIADEVSGFRATNARAGGATVVSQLGRYVPRTGPDKGRIIRERSVSVTVFREPAESWAAFRANIKSLAKLLVSKYGQWEIFVDFVRRGVTVEARTAFWKD